MIFIAALQAIPDSREGCRAVDGASAWQTFRYITLPLLKPTILLAAVLTMISSFQVFDLFQVMTNGGPDDQTRALSLDIYESAFRYQRMGWAAAVSVVLFLLVFTISLVQSRFLKRELGVLSGHDDRATGTGGARPPRRASHGCPASDGTRSVASRCTRCSRSSG